MVDLIFGDFQGRFQNIHEYFRTVSVFRLRG